MKRLAVLFFGLVWLLFWLVLLEVGAGWWIDEHGDALDRTRKVVWADGHFGWRQKPNLDLEFEGKGVRTNEMGLRTHLNKVLFEAGKQKALVMGPSSAFGWGVGDDEPYSSQLERMLATGPEALLVINAGEIGWSSFQGIKMIRDTAILGLKPSVIFLAYGVNDVDRHRFYFQSALPDAQELKDEKPESKVKLFRLMARSDLLSLLYKLANGIRAAVSYGNAPDMNVSPVPPLRVGAPEYLANMLTLIREAKKLGARPVVLGTPVHLPSAAAAKDSDLAFAEGQGYYESKQLEKALASFLRASEQDPFRNETWYYLAAAANGLGKFGDAKKYAQKARDTEPYRIHRDVLVYNGLAKRAAEQEGVTFVDLHRIFEGKDKGALFVDPVHPSAEGHRMIAEEIRKVVFGLKDAGTKRERR